MIRLLYFMHHEVEGSHRPFSLLIPLNTCLRGLNKWARDLHTDSDRYWQEYEIGSIGVEYYVQSHGTEDEMRSLLPPAGEADIKLRGSTMRGESMVEVKYNIWNKYH